MRIVFDLDGVICELKKPNEKYDDVKANKEVIKRMQDLKREGHFIIISTARHMRTCNGNVKKVIAKIGGGTINWLKRNNVPFDEIYFGKPYADIYVDDANLIYSSPEQLENELHYKRPNFIIPMAGQGKRFLSAGYKIPKYMVKAHSETLLEWSLKSLPLDLANSVIFCCLLEHEKKYKVSQFIKNIIREKYPFLDKKILITYIKHPTRGQAETVLRAKDYFDKRLPLAVYNIDTYFFSSRLRQKLLTLRNKKIDGLLGVFHGWGTKWSFAKLDKNEYVTKTTEKKPISNIACTGLYVFTEGRLFTEVARHAIKVGLRRKGEFYIAPLYNLLIRKKGKFIVDFVEDFHPLGTPEDVEFFIKNYQPKQ